MGERCSLRAQGGLSMAAWWEKVGDGSVSNGLKAASCQEICSLDSPESFPEMGAFAASLICEHALLANQGLWFINTALPFTRWLIFMKYIKASYP